MDENTRKPEPLKRNLILAANRASCHGSEAPGHISHRQERLCNVIRLICSFHREYMRRKPMNSTTTRFEIISPVSSLSLFRCLSSYVVPLHCTRIKGSYIVSTSTFAFDPIMRCFINSPACSHSSNPLAGIPTLTRTLRSPWIPERIRRVSIHSRRSPQG